MTDDVRGLVARAVLETDAEPPVVDLVRRAGTRRRRRHAGLGVTGLLVVGVVAAAVTGLGITRVDLTPAGPSPQSGGWPLEARFEIVDLDYGEFIQEPRAPVLRTVEELAATSWDTWTHVDIAMYELRPDGDILVGDNPTHVSRMTPEWDESGTLDVRDTTVPFAALEAARDAVVGDRTPRDPEVHPAPGRVLGPVPEDYGEVPGVRLVDGDATAVRDRVAAELDLDAGELDAVVTVEEFCGPEGPFVGRCDEPEVRVERTFVHHAPTGLPLYRSWRPVDGMPNELAALGLDEVVELRATHVRLSTDEEAAPDPPADVLDVPPVGEAASTWLPNGVPVFVVHDRTGEVSVVEAVNPHAVVRVARPLGWCPGGYLLDEQYGSAFGPAGRYLQGRAPSDLVAYRTRPGPVANTVAVLDRVVPTGRSTADGAGYAESCEAAYHGGSPDREAVYGPAEAVRAQPAGWVLVAGSVGVDGDGRVWACDAGSGSNELGGNAGLAAWDCAGEQVPIVGLDAGGRLDTWLWAGTMWVLVTDDGLRRPAHPQIDGRASERPPSAEPAPRPGPTTPAAEVSPGGPGD